MITIKYVDLGAFGKAYTSVISYSNLLNGYYQNQDQKNEVNDDTDKMQNDHQGYM